MFKITRFYDLHSDTLWHESHPWSPQFEHFPENTPFYPKSTRINPMKKTTYINHFFENPNGDLSATFWPLFEVFLKDLWQIPEPQNGALVHNCFTWNNSGNQGSPHKHSIYTTIPIPATSNISKSHCSTWNIHPHHHRNSRFLPETRFLGHKNSKIWVLPALIVCLKSEFHKKNPLN